jgi:hypothetical protein
MDLVGQKVLSKILSGIFIILGILFMNRLISFSITGNSLYDSILLIIIGLFIFIIGHAFKGPKTMSGY